MKISRNHSRFCRFLPVGLVVAILATAAHATVIVIDLTQAAPFAGNTPGDTWRWAGTPSPKSFDLEFSSGNGVPIDLDGGIKQGSEYYTGTEAANNHTYDKIQASYLGGNSWQIAAIRGATTYQLGTVTEYIGAASHTVNYGYGNSESDPLPGGGPPAAGRNGVNQEAYWAWFWIYRSTADDTVSLNIVAGTGNIGGGDAGSLRAEITFSGNYTGTLAVLQGNEPSEVGLSGNTFTGDWSWDGGLDDGGSLGGITPVPIPEPSGILLSALGLSLLLLRRGRDA
jgi:hypothetical protein